MVHAHPRRLGLGRGARRRRHIDPDQAILLAHRIGADLDLFRIEILPRHQRGNGAAHAIFPEAPAVIGAFHAVVGLDPPRRQRHAAMGADVAQGEQRAVMAPAQQNRLAQQHLAAHVAALQAGGERRHVPEVAQEQIIGHGNLLKERRIFLQESRKTARV